jgi:hypothetical protein
MKRKVFTVLSVLLILFPLIHCAGCGTAKSIYEISADTAKSVTKKVMPGQEAVLRKRIQVVPIMDRAGIKDEKIMQYTDTLVSLLNKDDHLRITLSKEIDSSDSDIMSSEYDIVTNPGLVKEAEEIGMDILITTTINPFEVSTEESGIWPFRKMKKEIDISVTTNTIDISNGTLILAMTETRKINIEYEEDTDENEDTWEIDYEILDEELQPMLKRHSSEVSDTLSVQPWTGRIMLVDNRLVKINGGEDVGVTLGSIFEVFGKEETITSLSGRDYFYLGPKVGEIKTEEVMQEYSLAVPLNDEILEEGQLVRLKR